LESNSHEHWRRMDGQPYKNYNTSSDSSFSRRVYLKTKQKNYSLGEAKEKKKRKFQLERENSNHPQ
jgi:hypothetical protein